MAHPEISSISDDGDLEAFSKIIPIYPANKEFSKARITSSLLQKWIMQILNQKNVTEFLPLQILKNNQFPEKAQALRNIHNPNSHQEHKIALERFKFEELFLFELSMCKIKHEVSARESGHIFGNLKPNTSTYFNKLLPFELTDGQKQALSDIKRDVRSGKQMNRLLQGDVGAGKTIVAIGAMLMAVDNGFQAALLRLPKF